MATFPALGDSFPSVNAFKLAAFRGCLVHGVSPAGDVGTSTHAHIRCRLTTRSTADTLWPNAPRCAFFVGASNRDCEGAREVKVSRACGEHTCSAAARPAYADEGRRDLERKVVKMELKVAEEAWAGETEDKEEEYVEEDEEEEGAQARSEQVKRRKRRVLVLSSSESEAGDEGGEVGARYPSANQLKEQVDALLKAGNVSFPSRDQTLASPAALLLVLYAYARQHYFSFFRKSNARIADHLVLRCWRGHSRFSQTEDGCCPAQVEAHEVADGHWRITSYVFGHNHSLNSAAAPAMRGRTGPARKRPRLDVSVAASPAHRADAPPVAAAAAAISSRAIPQPFLPTSFPQPVFLAPFPQPSGAPAPAAKPSSSVLALLTSAFSAFAPADVAAMAVSLAAAGLSTAQDVVALLHMDPALVALIDEDARQQAVGSAPWAGLVGVQEALRTAWGRV